LQLRGTMRPLRSLPILVSIIVPALFAARSARAQVTDPTWSHPQLELGFELGGAAMEEGGALGFNTGVGTVTHAGPAWGARVGLAFTAWLAIEVRYLGMYNSASASVSPNGNDGFLTSAGDAVVRLMVPTPYVRPYGFGGIGYYAVDLVGAAGSELHSSSQSALLFGFGLEVPLDDRWSISAEAGYHHQNSEDYSAVTTNGIDGGDFTTVTAVVRARL
jgi:opacity protein-like surface antigen